LAKMGDELRGLVVQKVRRGKGKREKRRRYSNDFVKIGA